MLSRQPSLRPRLLRGAAFTFLPQPPCRLHYHSANMYRSELAALARYMQASAAWLSTAAVWVDTSEQHFNTPGGRWAASVFGGGAGPLCVPQGSVSGQVALPFNDVAAPFAAALGPGGRLATGWAGAPQWDLHLTCHPNGKLDCTHWCQPGVPEVWLEALNSLLADQGLGGRVQLALGSGRGGSGRDLHRWV